MEKYDNLGMIGEGSYGMVMKCKHKETGQVVAIKKFLESEDDKLVKKIALREVRMLRKLRHENLVNLIEVFRRRKRLYLVFEFVDHTVLDDLEKYPDGLSEEAVRKILWQVLRGVEFCHGHNIIHRDIKPENILHSKNGVIKLCDFGFARTLASPGEAYTDYVATRWYRAPELLVGDTKYGRAVDIWALGCLLGEMLYGDPIFPGKSDLDQLSKILKCVGNVCPRHREIFLKNPLYIGMKLPDVKEIEPLEKRFPQLSLEAIDLMKQSLRLDPDDRPSCSLLLKHEFFKKDGFEEKVIPDLHATILKETASNLLARKEVNERKVLDKERKQRMSRERLSDENTNNDVENKDSSTNITKDSADLNTNNNSPKLDRLSPIILNEGLPKPVKKPLTNITDISYAIEEKKQKREYENVGKQSVRLNQQLPSLDQTMPHHESRATTPRSSLFRTLHNDLPNKSSSANIKCSAESLSKTLQISPVRSTADTINEVSQTKPIQKAFAREEEMKSLNQNSLTVINNNYMESKNSLQENEVDHSIDERQEDINKVSQSVDTNFGEKYNHKTDDNISLRKETDNDPLRQPIIPPISTIYNAKHSNPDPMLVIDTSSSPHGQSNKSSGATTSVGSPSFRSSDKLRRGSNVHKSDVTGQGTFDKNMYPDKSANFEKLMISMSGATSITHPAIRKTSIPHAVHSPPSVINTSAQINEGPSGIQQLRHLHHDKASVLPIWSSVEAKPAAFLQFSVDPGIKHTDQKHYKVEDVGKASDKSPKSNKRESKNLHPSNEEKHSKKTIPNNSSSIDKEPFNDPKATKFPNLGVRTSIGQEKDLFPLLTFHGLDGPAQKPKSKPILSPIPLLDQGGSMKFTQRSRSPSPPNNVEANFPSVYAKN